MNSGEGIKGVSGRPVAGPESNSKALATRIRIGIRVPVHNVLRLFIILLHDPKKKPRDPQ